MARISKAEKEFRAKYPNARVVVDPISGSIKKRSVYAGDYLCAESVSRAIAFSLALDYATSGTITPDPNEVATTKGHPSA